MAFSCACGMMCILANIVLKAAPGDLLKARNALQLRCLQTRRPRLQLSHGLRPLRRRILRLRQPRLRPGGCAEPCMPSSSHHRLRSISWTHIYDALHSLTKRDVQTWAIRMLLQRCVAHTQHAPYPQRERFGWQSSTRRCGQLRPSRLCARKQVQSSSSPRSTKVCGDLVGSLSA